MEEIIKKLDVIIAKVNLFKIEDKFTEEYNIRLNKTPPSSLNKRELFEIFVKLISYSQQAQSKNVKKILDAKIFNEIFDNYNPTTVAIMNPCDVVDNHWHKITGIRQQTKIFQIIMFARLIERNQEILNLLTNPNIPKAIISPKDIEDFWLGFKSLQIKLRNAKTPFLRETTTLLHFLLELGYDCIKPDSAVMKASKQLGIIENISGEKNLIETVQFIQNYSLNKELRPSIIDLYMLIEGGQTESATLVNKAFYS